jgi:hypothetical protein
MTNPYSRGQIRDKPFRDALRMEIDHAGTNHKALRRVARALIERAAEGDVAAIREVADRLDGRVPQLVGGDRENPVQFQRIERVIVQVKHARPALIEQQPADVKTEVVRVKPLISLWSLQG